MQHMEDMINLFVSFKQAQGLAPRTIRDYRVHLGHVNRLLNGGNSYRTASLAYLSGNINNTTYNFRFRALMTFYNFCIEEGLMEPPHPLKGLKRKKGVNRIVNISDDVICKLLSLPDKSTFCGLRDYTLLLFSIDNGCRPSESLALRKSDFDFNGLFVTVNENISKTRTKRLLPMTIQTCNAVRKLIDSHHKEWKDAPVFCNFEGNCLSENSWGHRLKKYSKTLGVNITPYMLRHVCALANLRNGMQIPYLKSLLSHTDIATTQIYLSGLSFTDLQQAHSQSSLINKIAPLRNRKIKLSRYA
jgi:site-specific recombinase XerD